MITYMNGNIDRAPAIADISFKVYFINSFKAYLLFETDILDLYSIDINFEKRWIIDREYRSLLVPITISNRLSLYIWGSIVNKYTTITPPRFGVNIPITYYSTFLSDRDSFSNLPTTPYLDLKM